MLITSRTSSEVNKWHADLWFQHFHVQQRTCKKEFSSTNSTALCPGTISSLHPHVLLQHQKVKFIIVEKTYGFEKKA
jgi:hypothetical protein